MSRVRAAWRAYVRWYGANPRRPEQVEALQNMVFFALIAIALLRHIVGWGDAFTIVTAALIVLRAHEFGVEFRAEWGKRR